MIRQKFGQSDLADMVIHLSGNMCAFTAARDSYDCRAKDEFRKLATEFTIKAEELEKTTLTVTVFPFMVCPA